MVPSPHSWYRSPVLWFFIPGVVFILWAWGHSMFHFSTMNFGVRGYSVQLRNGQATAGASWREISPGYARSVASFGSSPLDRPARKEWFPLPSYVSGRIGGLSWHTLSIPHWFVLMVLFGLWQLPWLGRYYRRKRIAAAHSP